MLSDLFDDVDAMVTGLMHLRHRRHEVIVMHVLDPAELDFPFEELTLFHGLEAIARRAGRSAGLAPGVPRRVWPLPAQAEGRLPRPRDRLRADADRSVVGSRVVELPGVATMKEWIVDSEEWIVNHTGSGCRLLPIIHCLLATTHYHTIHYPLMILPQLLLAFGWNNLPMLGWLAIAAVPLLIHLWSRRKYREMSWAAMEFLLGGRETANPPAADRTMVAALDSHAARGADRAGRGRALHGAGRLGLCAGGHAHRVLVIDGSYSMAYQPTDKTRFERAKELARQIVEESPQGDAFTLVPDGRAAAGGGWSAGAGAGEITGEIDNLQLTHADADLPATIRMVRRMIDAAEREDPRLARHEVYFLSDMQRTTWAPKLSEAATAEFQQQTGELSERAVLFVIDLGQPATENVAITSLRASDPLVMVGRNVSLVAELKSFGHEPRRGQPITLLVDHRRIEQKNVDLAPESAGSVEFSYRFDTPGDHAIEVQTTGDGLEVDNHRFLAVPCGKRFACCASMAGPRATRSTARPITWPSALSPQEQKFNQAPVQANVATEAALMEGNLNEYDCIVRCATWPSLPPARPACWTIIFARAAA